MAQGSPPRRLAAIVCVDMAGYTALAERDEAAAAASVAVLRQSAEEAARAHGGRIFNTAGDGFLLEFNSANEAVGAGLEIVDRARANGPPVRIGIHLGDVMVTPTGDLLGHAVNIASRLQSEAGENCIIASRAVFDLARGPDTIRLSPIGRIAIDKTSAAVEAFAFDPAGPRGDSTGRRPRRRFLSAGAASAVAIVALAAAVWSASVVGANQRAALEQLTASVTRQLVASGAISQESIDSAYGAVSDLSKANTTPERAAFALLQKGQTESAVDALEAFAGDLKQQQLNSNAASAWARAGALAQFTDKSRALADYQNAHQLAPNSLDYFAALIGALTSAQGYDAALKFADDTIANRATSPEIGTYARLMASILCGDIGASQRQRAYVEAAQAPLRALDNSYLVALDKIARGYLAFQHLDLHRARALYREGRAALALIPGHEHDHQQGWLLVLSASGDFDEAWREGRDFIAERQMTGAPPWSQMMVTTCIAGLLADRAQRAEAICLAGAQGVAGSVGEPSGEFALALLAAEKEDTVAARAHLEASRLSPWYPAQPSNLAYTGWIEARIAFKEGRFDEVNSVVERTLRRMRVTSAMAAPMPMFTALLERRRAEALTAQNRTGDACAALARATSAYRQIGGDRGESDAEQLAADLDCASLPN